MFISKFKCYCINHYACTQPGVAGGRLFLSCLCVHRETLLTRYHAEYLMHLHLHQRCIMGQRRMLHSLGSAGQKSRSWWINMLESSLHRRVEL